MAATVVNFKKNSLSLNTMVMVIIITITTELVVIKIDGQSSFWSTIQDFDRFIPVFGSCDRIVYAGVANCMANFSPTRIGSSGSCCSYRKYRACIAGLRDGHSFAVARERCPPYSISMPVIWTISDRLVGLPLSSCKDDRNACRKSRKTSSSSSSLFG